MDKRSWPSRLRTAGRNLCVAIIEGGRRITHDLIPESWHVASKFRRDERLLAREAPSVPPLGTDTPLPLPPPYLRVLVSADPDGEWFLRGGEAHARLVLDLAAAHGVTLDRPRSVLDFGCGCGRIARWIAPAVEDAGGAFTGSDYNPRLVRWCAGNLPGRYVLNRLRPPFRLPGGSQDLVYAYSVVTHLTLPVTRAWLHEVARVLKPGGLALVSFHDEDFRAEPHREALERVGYAVSTPHLEGANYMAAYAKRSFFAELGAEAFEVVEIRPSDLSRELQAWAVLRRPTA